MSKEKLSIRHLHWQKIYQKLRQRLERALQSGVYHSWSKHRQYQVQRRLSRYSKRLWSPLARVAPPVTLSTALFLGLPVLNATITGTKLPMTNITSSPEVSLSLNATTVEEDSGNNLVYTFTRTGATTEALVVNFSISGTATVNTDYTISGESSFVTNTGEGTITIAMGSSSATLTISPSTDTAIEADESVIVTIIEGVKGTPDFSILLPNVGSSARPTFADIDGDGDLDAFVGVGGFSGDTGNILYYENNGSGSFTATETNPFGLSDVGYYASPTFADIDGDGDLDAFVGNRDGNILYYENNGSGSFTATQTNPFGLSNVGRFASPTFADIDGDGDLDAFVGDGDGNIIYFENKATPYEIATGAAMQTGVIQDDDSAFSIIALAAVQAEGNSGTTDFTFTVTRTGDLSQAAMVDYAVSGAAVNTADFGGTLPSGTLSFAANETSQTLTIQISGDVMIESDEDFTVTLSNPSQGTISSTSASATGTIQNDDSISLDFDGINDVISIPNFSFPTQFTIEFWIYYPGRHQDFEALITSFDSYSYNTPSFVLGLNEGDLNVLGTDLASSSKLPINEWTHVALTYQDSQFKGFFNGNLVASELLNEAFRFPNQQALDIGKNDVFNSSKMIIDDFRIWERSLSAQQIQERQSCTLSGEEPHLSHYFNFDQAIPSGNNQHISNIPNLVDNEANATLHNFSLTGLQSNFVKGGPMLNQACANSLAIEWLNFTGYLTKGQQTQLNWKVLSTTGLKHFVIERSINGQAFEEIASLAADGSNLNEATPYTYLDKDPQNGLNYYRIKTVELDGSSTNSTVVVVELANTLVATELLVYPNPNQGQAGIVLPSHFEVEESLQLTILNNLGQVVQVAALTNTLEGKLDLNHQHLPTGVYFVQVQQGQHIAVARMMVE